MADDSEQNPDGYEEQSLSYFDHLQYASNQSPFTFQGFIPSPTSHGMLPMGVFVCTLEQIEEAFGSSTPRRIELWQKFLQLFALMQQHGAGFLKSVYIDGSFTTDKLDPGDIDIVLELPDFDPQDQSIFQHRPDLLMLVANRPHWKQLYEVDVLVWHPRSPQKTPFDLINFFQAIRPKVAQHKGLPKSFRKGILKVIL